MEATRLCENFLSGDLLLSPGGHDDGREKMRVRRFLKIGILPNHLVASSNHVPNLAIQFPEASHHDVVFVL